jgi:hypothetical protein
MLALFLFSSSATAQTAGATPITTNTSPPAEKMAMTPGGVDIRTGHYVHDDIDLTIGDPSESGGLALQRGPITPVPGHVFPFANFSQNWNITLVEKRINVAQANYSNAQLARTIE